MGAMRCPTCAWENEAGARMCGGCGRPLRPSPTGSPGASYSAGGNEPRGPYGSYRPGAAGHAGYGAPDVTDPDMPTVRDYPPLPQQRSTTPATPRPARWPGAAQSPARRGSGTTGRTILVLVALLALLSVLVWSTAIRPQLHQHVDALMRAQMLAMVATINRAPAIPTTTVSVSGDQATANLQGGIPSDVPIQNVQVAFQGGRTFVSFTTYGLSGSAATELAATNGRLTATNTTVDGPVGLLESGGELQDTLNAALGTLRHDVTIKQVTEQNNTLTVSIKGTV